MKTTLTLFIFLALFIVNTVAQDFTHTVFELEDEPVEIGSVNSVAFSPDGKTLATGGFELHLWDIDTATHKAEFDHGSFVYSVAFSPDGKTLATGGYDPRIHLWDIDTATHKAEFDHGSFVYSVAFSPDGKTLATGGYDPRIHLWDIDTATHKAEFDHGSSVRSVAFSPDGKTLATAGGNRIHLWDIDTATHKAEFKHGSSVRSVAFSPDGKTLAAAGRHRIHLWDIDTATHKTTFVHNGGIVRSVAFSPDGKTFAAGTEGESIRLSSNGIHLWDIDTATHKISHVLYKVYSVAFSPDGKTLAAGGVNRVHLWNVDASQIKITLPVRYRSPINSVAFSPDGKTLATGGNDPRIHLWEVDTATHKTTFVVHDDRRHSPKTVPYFNSVAFSPDGKTLATADRERLTRGTLIIGYESRIHLWEVDTATHKTTFVHEYSSVRSVAFSPDGKTLATAGGNRIHLWEVDTATHKTTFVHDDRRYSSESAPYSNSVAFSPDGKTLATAGGSRIHLWDVDASQIKITLPSLIHDGPALNPTEINSVAFSPDGKTLATAGRNSIYLWDIDTATHKTEFNHGSSVHSVAFSPDGKTLATAGGSRIHLWDVDAATHKAEFDHGSSVHSVAFSPDGKTLATAGANPSTRLWKFPATHLNVTPYPVMPPAIGEQFTVNLSIVDGEDVGGYQLTVGYDETILRYVESANGDYLSPGSFFVPPVVSENAVTLSATSLAGTSNGDGTLATITFEVLEVKESAIALSDAILTDSASKRLSVFTNSGRIEPTLSSTSAVVDLTPSSVPSPAIGEQLAFNIRISDGQNVAGYQVSLEYDIKALKPVLASNEVYLPDASPAKPLISEGLVTLGASSTTGVGNGDGVLATITFEVLVVQASTVNVSGYLTTPNGLRSTPTFKGAELIAALLGDVNRDGSVDLQDLAIVGEHLGQQGQNSADVNEDGVVDAVDIALVADEIKNNAAAPSLQPQVWKLFTAEDVKLWLAQAQHLNLTDARFQRGILFLQQLLIALIPKEPALLANYPNPFNPETWIPYQLTKPADVTLTIYAIDGTVVRTLALGHKPMGIYQNKSRAVYWDGKNEVGESIASGVYFYTLTAGDFTATRKMLIRK